MKKGNTIRQYTMSLDKVIYQEIDMELKQLSELLGCDENIDQITTKINELKANQIVIKPEPEKITLSLVKENRSIKVNQLVSNGNITPATAKKLNDTICNQESVIKLSLTEPEVNRIIDEVIVALSLNKAIDLTERTGEHIAPDEKLLSDTRKTKDAEETFMKYYNNNLIPQNVK
jgi:polyhydroxyalkanoate synthesis regulator phasin